MINVTKKGYLEPAYAYGAIVTVLPGWSVGTALGVIVGDVIPAFAVSALGVAIFGMFIAIIIPPAVKNRVIAVTVLASFVLSTVVNKLSFFDFIPEGTKTIILTVVIALAAAIIRPIPTDEDCE